MDLLECFLRHHTRLLGQGDHLHGLVFCDTEVRLHICLKSLLSRRGLISKQFALFVTRITISQICTDKKYIDGENTTLTENEKFSILKCPAVCRWPWYVPSSL